MYVKFQVCNLHHKRDIHVKKIKVQKLILEYIPYCLIDSTVDSYYIIIYIIKKVPYSVLNWPKCYLSILSIYSVVDHFIATTAYHPCLSLKYYFISYVVPLGEQW